jgi:hypothetical protein
MPWGDRTGPWGAGPMTGRAMGYCAGYPGPGYMNAGFGFGRGPGRFRGRGFGWRRWQGYVPVPAEPAQRVWGPAQVPQTYQLTKQEEIQMLEDETKAIEEEQKILKQEHEETRKRIEELKKQK